MLAMIFHFENQKFKSAWHCVKNMSYMSYTLTTAETKLEFSFPSMTKGSGIRGRNHRYCPCLFPMNQERKF